MNVICELKCQLGISYFFLRFIVYFFIFYFWLRWILVAVRGIFIEASI